MQVQVNTDDHIEGREALAARVESTVVSALGHLCQHISRLEIHLSDENGDKGGQDDQRCIIEARLEGRQPTAVTYQAATLDKAVAGATDKLKTSLARTIERRQEHR